MNTYSSSTIFPIVQSRDVAEKTTTTASTGALAWRIRTATRPWLFRRRWPAEPVGQAQKKLEWYGSRAGVAWPQGATLREYAALLASQISDNESLPEIVELVERAQYGRYTLDADEQRRLQMAGEQVWVRLTATPVLRADG
jgi:hypothetical protein